MADGAAGSETHADEGRQDGAANGTISTASDPAQRTETRRTPVCRLPCMPSRTDASADCRQGDGIPAAGAATLSILA